MKKILSTILVLVILFTSSITSYATNTLQYTITKGDINGVKNITIEYKEDDKNIRTVIGSGYRFTTTINKVTGVSELYISENSEEFIVDENYNNLNELVLNCNEYIYDRHQGRFTINTDIEPRAGVIHRRTESLTGSYMRHYSDGKYSLKWINDSFYSYSTTTYVNTYSYKFAETLEEIDGFIPTTLFDVLGVLSKPANVVGQFMSLIYTITQDYDNAKKIEAAKEEFVNRINTGVLSIAGIGSAYVAPISLAMTLCDLGMKGIDADLYFNYVKPYAVL